MIFRFSLYGFLKNQRYFEAFLVLAFLDKGLSFFEIGLLAAVRELTINVLEVPSGAIADVCGRRFVMITSFVAYIVSFIVFGVADDVPLLAPAMICFGIGDAFRTGTHKAMIFAWLRMEGRTDERVRVYGYTRSWSKIGSAASVVLAAVIVIVSDGYSAIFFVSIVPYALGIVNFLGYPAALDGRAVERPTLRSVLRHLVESVRVVLGGRSLRRLVAESMGFDGVFDAAKDYLQPVLAAAAITATAAWLDDASWSDERRAALLVGPVYFGLYLLAAVASRQSHRVSDRFGEERAARWLWIANAALFAGLAAAAYVGLAAALIAAFVATHVLHNIWRPILISRFDHGGTGTHGASILSIENQARRSSTMILAPLLGLAVDAVTAQGPGGPYWPVGVVGCLVSLAFVVAARARRSSP